MNFINQEIESYCLKFSSKENKILKKLYRETHHKMIMPRMISGHYMGLVLKFIASLKKPKKILEIGMFTGYSTICLANELAEKGELHTIEINEEIIDFASKFIKESKLEKKIHIHTGDAKNIISKMKKKFDLIFIDADKANYINYFDISLELLKKGGIILADNVFWHGDVYNKNKDDKQTNIIREFNLHVKNDKRVEKFILPLGDGLTICKKV